jgi:hypothetical protein
VIHPSLFANTFRTSKIHIRENIRKFDDFAPNSTPKLFKMGLRNFRFYELQAFRGGQHWDRTRTYEPKQQATRTRRLAEFYGQHDQTEFTEMKRGMIRRFLAEGRPVVFLLRLGGDEAQSRELGGDLEWTLRRQFDGFSYGPWRGESGPWGLYEVRSRPQPQPEGRG